MKTTFWKNDVFILITTCIVSGFLILLPKWFDLGISESAFFENNAALIAFFGLTLFSLMIKKNLNLKMFIIIFLIYAVSAVYINVIGVNSESSSVDLSQIHLPLMLWCLYGFIFADFKFSNKSGIVDYFKLNGELAILIAVTLITGGIMMALTVNLFQAIDVKLEALHIDQIALVGLVSVPIIATFIIRRYPSIAGKIAPVIAGIFSPMVLVILVIFLVSLFFVDKDPFNDRDFLLVFNFMLMGVMALIVFSVSETAMIRNKTFGKITLLALTVVTLVIDIIALTAIIYRLGEYGITPNRFAVLCTNILVFGNILLIMIDLIKVNFKNRNIEIVELTIARYLPVYAVWTVFAVFFLPLIFGFK